MESHILSRLTGFLVIIMLKQCEPKAISALAHKELFNESEHDTGVYAYDAFEKMDVHPESDLVLKFLDDSRLKVFASWQGVSLTLEANLPNMGWDAEGGEFGMGGDWWKRI